MSASLRSRKDTRLFGYILCCEREGQLMRRFWKSHVAPATIGEGALGTVVKPSFIGVERQ